MCPQVNAPKHPMAHPWYTPASLAARYEVNNQFDNYWTHFQFRISQLPNANASVFRYPQSHIQITIMSFISCVQLSAWMAHLPVYVIAFLMSAVFMFANAPLFYKR